MADLDLEQFEQLMQQEQLEKQQKPSQDTLDKSKLTMQESGNHHNRQKGTKKGGSSPDSRDDGDRNNDGREKDSSRRDRDRRRGRDDKRKSRSRSRDSHSDDGRRKRRESRHGCSRSDSQELEAKAERKRQEALQRSLEEAKRQAEEAQRDDCTVLVTRIHLRADEKEIYQFFAQAGVGKIRDIRLIRDQRSNKSKGIAYVEFYTPESVLMALAMSNQQIRGQTIMINASQAEKNRQAAANKYKKVEKSEIPSLGNTLAPRYQHQQREQNNRIYIGGLVGHLATLGQQDIRQFFSPFGQIDAIELPKDPYTGKNRGHSIVEFSSHKEARIAAQSMNGFELMHGQKLKVNILTDVAKGDPNHKEEDLGEDTTNTYLHSAQDRTALMQKLSRNKDALLPGAPNPMNSADGARMGSEAQPSAARPSNCLLFEGMFDTTQVDLKKDPSFFMDVKDQVLSCCQEFGKVERVYVEQNSNGHVWIMFKPEDIAGALKTQESLNNQLFDGNPIAVSFVTESDFMAKVKER